MTVALANDSDRRDSGDDDNSSDMNGCNSDSSNHSSGSNSDISSISDGNSSDIEINLRRHDYNRTVWIILTG